MRLNRVYQAVDLAKNQTLSLDRDAAKHLAQVLRMAVGDSLVLFNGKGGEYSAVIEHIAKNQVAVKIVSFQNIELESPLKIHLAQCISRGEKMDLTIQKAVELGVNEITPIISTRCGVKLSDDRWDKKSDHWQKIIISACEQCGRNTLPVFNQHENLINFIEDSKKNTTSSCFILDHRSEKKLSAITTANHSITLLIGPEGGFTENEIMLATQSNFTPIHLGARILRTETAGFAAISALQTLFGDF